MMDKIILAGFGGQGVMFLGKVLAVSGMLSDLQLCWIPSYGPEMRGGTANCSVILSEEVIYSPVITEADAVIALNQPSYEKFVDRVKPGGVIIVNSSLVTVNTPRKDIKTVQIPATSFAHDLGKPSIANMVCLGAVIPFLHLTTFGRIERALNEEVAKKRPELLEINLQAITKGLNYVK